MVRNLFDLGFSFKGVLIVKSVKVFLNGGVKVVFFCLVIKCFVVVE